MPLGAAYAATMSNELRRRFHELHLSGTFVMPNPFDVGSAKRLENLGFEALATTSSGHAATLGRPDQYVTREELVAHVATLTAALSIPLSVDAEYCFADDLAGVADTVRLLADAAAAGCSIEDYNPTTQVIDPLEVSVERVGAAVEEANRWGMVLTARAEGLLYDQEDVDQIITRLAAFARAGAHCVYAPGLTEAEDIRRVVDSVDVAMNVLLLRDGPTVAELGFLGVRRISVGGALTWAAYSAVEHAGLQLLAGDFAFPPP